MLPPGGHVLECKSCLGCVLNEIYLLTTKKCAVCTVYCVLLKGIWNEMHYAFLQHSILMFNACEKLLCDFKSKWGLHITVYIYLFFYCFYDITCILCSKTWDCSL